MGLVPSGTMRSFSGPDGKKIVKKSSHLPRLRHMKKKVKSSNNVFQADTVTAINLS